MRRRYLEALAEAVTSLPERPGVYHAVVHHGPECSPSSCSCDPEITIEPATEENLAAGAEATRRWIKETSS